MSGLPVELVRIYSEHIYVNLAPHSYLWIFLLSILFAFADAFAIGSNDVANSFATAVGARTLTIGKAVCIALFTEFIGAAALGNNTSSTIRNGIIDISRFDGRIDLLMIAMLCSSIGSAVWVNIASYLGMPVSTTHSTVGAVMGVGISAYGFGSLDYSFEGVPSIFLSFIISPVIAGSIASVIFVVTRFLVLNNDNSLKRALFAFPIYAGIVSFLVSFSFVRKGAPTLKLKEKPIWLQCVMVGSFTLLAMILSIYPGVKLVKYYLKRWEQSREDFLCTSSLEDGSFDHSDASVDDKSKSKHTTKEHDVDNNSVVSEKSTVNSGFWDLDEQIYYASLRNKIEVYDMRDQHYKECKTLSEKWNYLKTVEGVRFLLQTTILSGLTADAREELERGVQKKNIDTTGDDITKFDPTTEKVFSFFQIFSASFASFSHGANDTANAVATFATVFAIYDKGGSAISTETEIPIWILLFGGASINLGLLIMGRKVLRSLGSKISYQSPSRGFSAEMGAVTTVLIATFLALPVSTTHCITGATIAIGMVNNYKSVNWHQVLKITSSWLLTLPFAGLVSGLIYYFLTHSPSLALAGVYYKPPLIAV